MKFFMAFELFLRTLAIGLVGCGIKDPACPFGAFFFAVAPIAAAIWFVAEELARMRHS
jgi:hypothetical protein